MDWKQYTTHDNLDKWSFLWSELRLVIAAVALFLGGVPPILLILRNTPFTWAILKLFWIISGLVSLYMIYRWNKNNKQLFGRKVSKDMYIFGINIVSGLNLGFAGLLNKNIGMSIANGFIVFILVGLLYVYCAYYLWNHWKQNGKRIF